MLLQYVLARRTISLQYYRIWIGDIEWKFSTIPFHIYILVIIVMENANFTRDLQEGYVKHNVITNYKYNVYRQCSDKQ